MRVDTSLLQGIAAANQAAQAKSSSLKSTGTTTSFSSALQSASTEKETTRPVEGANYAEILTGPRAGLYLNTSGGARDGQAFVLVEHDGREDHIYGTGKDRKVITVGEAKSSASSTTKAPAGETTKPIDRYAADILTGPRADLYLNTSGNARDGQAFVLVRHDGREDHIYGTGKDRKVITLGGEKSSASSTTKAPAGETTKPVDGQRYAEILTGPRAGLYLNTSGNARDGQAFTLVNRDGREFHVYGTGKDRVVVSVHRPADTGSTASATANTNDVITTDAATIG